MTYLELIRSLVLGQSVFLILFSLVNGVLTIVLHRPRPGRFLALIFTTMSYVTSITFIDLVIAQDTVSNTPRLAMIALVVILSGTFGVALLCAHLCFHSVKGVALVRTFFGHNDERPPD